MSSIAAAFGSGSAAGLIQSRGALEVVSEMGERSTRFALWRRDRAAHSIAFGLYNAPSAAPTDSAGVITFDCTVDAAPQITIGPGRGGSYSPRRCPQLATRSPTTSTSIPARTVVWDGTPITVPATGCTGQCGNGTQVSFYGRIFPLQDVAAGAYFDNLVVTIFF
jgi:spore coat protein U-like protein